MDSISSTEESHACAVTDCVQQRSVEPRVEGSIQSNGSHHCLTVASTVTGDVGVIVVNHSQEQEDLSGKEGVINLTSGHFVEQERRASVPPSESDHSLAEQVEQVSETNVECLHVIAMEPTSAAGNGGVDQIDIEADTRQENSATDGAEVEMTVFRSSDVMDQNMIPDNETLPVDTNASPPSYESVMRARMMIPTEEVSTTTQCCDSDTDVITTQPQSSDTSPPGPEVDDTNPDDMPLQLESEVSTQIDLERLREQRRQHRRQYRYRRRRPRGLAECHDLGILCATCYLCCPHGDTTLERENHADCMRDCFEVSCNWESIININ